MLSLVADENFNYDILRGVMGQFPEVDLVTLEEWGLRGITDPDLLAWAAEPPRMSFFSPKGVLIESSATEPAMRISFRSFEPLSPFMVSDSLLYITIRGTRLPMPHTIS